MNSKDKIEYSKKMVGQKVLVVGRPSYEALVVDTVDENTFAVRKKSSPKVLHVNIFDVRSLA